jgi:hypothetical protein
MTFVTVPLRAPQRHWGEENGWPGLGAPIQCSSRMAASRMSAAQHRKPCKSRGSRRGFSSTRRCKPSASLAKRRSEYAAKSVRTTRLLGTRKSAANRICSFEDDRNLVLQCRLRSLINEPVAVVQDRSQRLPAPRSSCERRRRACDWSDVSSAKCSRRKLHRRRL